MDTNVVSKLFQYFDFDQRLVMESLLVANDFKCDEVAIFHIKCLHHLAKRTLPQGGHDFKTERNMIIEHNAIVTAVVIVTVVILWVAHRSSGLVGRVAKKENSGIVKNFTLFEICQLVLERLQCSYIIFFFEKKVR